MTEINVQKVTKSDDQKLPVFEEAERMMQRIRDRAWRRLSRRGSAT
jgi:hypothetical protein